MRIAIASDGKQVSEHFGHCMGFNIFDIENEKVINEAFKANPGHRPGFLPKFLKELNVDAIISGGMGETAQQLFNENGIKVYTGVKGYCEDAVKKYITGDLQSTGSVCTEHQHAGDCNS